VALCAVENFGFIHRKNVQGDQVSVESTKASLSDLLAAERTFLAWIRTGLALMGFGFVVARFGLFLQRLQLIEPTPQAHSYGLSIWFGTSLLGAEVLVNLLSAWHHFRLVRALNCGGSDPRVRRSRRSRSRYFSL
jgi:putative membrane protein